MGWSRDSRGSDLEVGSGQTKEAQIVDPNAGQSRGLILGVDLVAEEMEKILTLV